MWKHVCCITSFSNPWCLLNSSWWSGDGIFFASSCSLLAFILCSHFLLSRARWSSVFPSWDTLLTDTQKYSVIYLNMEERLSASMIVSVSNLLWVICSSLCSSRWCLEAVKGLRGFWGLMRLPLSSWLSSLCGWDGSPWSSGHRSSCSFWCVCITETKGGNSYCTHRRKIRPRIQCNGECCTSKHERNLERKIIW